jgi:hypothetical protein
MKYIKSFDQKIIKTGKPILIALQTFFNESLPNNFYIKKTSDEYLNFKDTNINTNRNVCQIYVQTLNDNAKIHIAHFKIYPNNFNIAIEYLIDIFNNSNIPINIEYNTVADIKMIPKDRNYYTIKFNKKYYMDILNLINNIPTDEMSIRFNANKYNI